MKAASRFLLLGILLAGVAAWIHFSRTKSIPSGQLQLYGNVDIREVALGFRVSGRIAAVLQDEGDSVRRGDPLARLDAEPYRREADEAVSKVAVQRSRVALLEKGFRLEEIAQARAVVQEREITLANAERIFHRQSKLVATQAVSLQESEDAEARFNETAARLNSAKQQLALLESGARIEDIAQARSELASAEAALAIAELRIADTELKSPSDGVILTRARETGAIVQPGATVLTLSLREPVWVRAYVAEPDLGRVHPGMAAQIFTDSRPDHPYAGKIGFISPQAEFTPKTVETQDLRSSLVYRLRIVVTNVDEGLRQGMPVTVRLQEK